MSEKTVEEIERYTPIVVRGERRPSGAYVYYDDHHKFLRAAVKTERERHPSIEQLKSIEFAFFARYGAKCPACMGHQTEDYGYTTRGPDEGHEKDCWLKAAIRAEPTDGDGEGGEDG